MNLYYQFALNNKEILEYNDILRKYLLTIKILGVTTSNSDIKIYDLSEDKYYLRHQVLESIILLFKKLELDLDKLDFRIKMSNILLTVIEKNQDKYELSYLKKQVLSGLNKN